MAESTELQFAPIDAGNIERKKTTRTSKYVKSGLIDACKALTLGHALALPVPDDTEPGKFRLNLANACKAKVMGFWEGQGHKDWKLAVFLGEDNKVYLECKEYDPDAKKPGKSTVAPTGKTKTKAKTKAK